VGLVISLTCDLSLFMPVYSSHTHFSQWGSYRDLSKVRFWKLP
jgi:hypothetical protein